MRVSAIKFIAMFMLVFTPWINALAQVPAPFDVAYDCDSGKFTGTLDFSLCVPPGTTSDGYLCYFGSSFPTKTHPTGVGLASVGVTFLLSSLSPANQRFYCIYGSGGGYEGGLTGPLPFGSNTNFSGFAKAQLSKNLSDCSLWVQRGKPFNVEILAYVPSDLLTVTDALSCKLTVLHH